MKTTGLIRNKVVRSEHEIVQEELNQVPRMEGLTKESHESRPYIGTIEGRGFQGTRPVKK